MNIIHITDKSLKEHIESFFLSVYPANHLISHGLEHHKRVWNYANELLNFSSRSLIESDPLFIQKLMIACYFHDIGMASDYGVNHGTTSMNLCIEFLKKHNLDTQHYTDVLEAINNHDDKDYRLSLHMNSLLKILSVADDLDAFGFTGIFRYSDIYLRRNVIPAELGNRIRENASSRFQNFMKSDELSKDLFGKHSDRFRILDEFFIKYNRQVVGYVFGTTKPSGYCGVVDIIKSKLDNSEKDIFSNIFVKYSKDPVISWFFKGLTAELNQ
jgi:hypothetical protein